jgi:hypothetical protein
MECGDTEPSAMLQTLCNIAPRFKANYSVRDGYFGACEVWGLASGVPSVFGQWSARRWRDRVRACFWVGRAALAVFGVGSALFTVYY